MGYTNKTSHYDLPQWIAGDKPSWLGDVNTAMMNIDTALAAAGASASAAESSAAAANAQVQAQEAKITKNTADIQALTEQVADASGAANAALPKSGGAMTGPLTLAGAPTTDLMAATKKYVDDNSGKGALMLSGGTMTGPLTLSGAPTSNLMAATKKYVDDTKVSLSVFTPAASVSDNVLVSAIALNNVLILSAGGDTTSGQIASGTTLASIAGNPLNLTLNTTYSCGNIIGITGSGNSRVVLRCKYDGTNTVITAGGNIQQNYIWTGSFCGAPIS